MSDYTIVGNHTIDGVPPGGTVQIGDEVRARRLVRGGHLEPADHTCAVCGKQTKTASGLASHERTHDSEDD